MSDSPYGFKIKNDKLFISYISDQGVEWVFDKLSLGSTTLLGKVFTITEGEKLGESDEGGEAAEFPIGQKEGSYFLINPVVLGTKNSVAIHENVITQIDPEHFFMRQPYFDRRSGHGSTRGVLLEKYIPLFPKLEKMFTGAIRIGGNEDDSIPFEVFLRAINVFPDREEVKRYLDARVAQILDEYLIPKRNYEAYRDNLIESREKGSGLQGDTSLFEATKDSKLKIFQSAYNELQEMLESSIGYREAAWQDKILDIILLLYPKYIHKEKNVKITTDDSHGFVDIALFDAGGYIDLIEIKKPEVNNTGVLRKTAYRKNYIPSRELSGAIMQVEKYSFWLSRWGKDGERYLQKEYATNLPTAMEIRIANPMGIIIFGRDNHFGREERQDFEIIRRKYKHIVDILTYDDLLRRIKNIIVILKAG